MPRKIKRDPTEQRIALALKPGALIVAAFEPVAKGDAFHEPPSVLERAKDRWGAKRGGSRS
jgi:hypothetical protein